jgi:peptidoglycan/LPS O-acetylase OafA/YrhL
VKTKAEIASLTGLRGLACLLVVVAHFFSPTRAASEIPAWMPHVFSTPGIGMAIFFTLSGFVIALSYSHWDWRGRPAFNLTRLFFYRFARLYPGFLLFAVVIIMRTPFFDDPDHGTTRYLVDHLLLAQAWFPVTYDGQLSPSDHFHVSWSLSVECGLYFVFGIAAIIIGTLPPWRDKALHLTIAYLALTTVFLVSAWIYRAALKPDGLTDDEWWRWLMFFSPIGVSVQFVIGVVAYRISLLPLPRRLLLIGGNIGGLGLVAIYLLLIGGAFISFRDLGNPLLTTLVALATALIMIGSRTDSVVTRLLSGAGIVYIGTISYSLYLFHQFIPPLTSRIRFTAFDGMSAAFHAFNFLVAIGMAVIFATGVYMIVEVPARRAIRAGADRLLGISTPTSSPRGAPAE